MLKLVNLILADPEAFARSEVPCCLQSLWEMALDDRHGEVHSELVRP